jgi:hypothetical protein
VSPLAIPKLLLIKQPVLHSKLIAILLKQIIVETPELVVILMLSELLMVIRKLIVN